MMINNLFHAIFVFNLLAANATPLAKLHFGALASPRDRTDRGKIP